MDEAELTYLLEERAAIAELDGGLAHEEALELARVEVDLLRAGGRRVAGPAVRKAKAEPEAPSEPVVPSDRAAARR